MNPPNPAQIVAVGLCLGFFALVLLCFEIFVFRLSCLLSGVPRPGLLRTVSLVTVLLAIPAIVDGFFAAILAEVYLSAGYPLWEAGLVQFFLALPAHMAICSFIHARIMRVRLGEGLSVWFMDKLLKAGVILAAVACVVALVALVKVGT